MRTTSILRSLFPPVLLALAACSSSPNPDNPGPAPFPCSAPSPPPETLLLASNIDGSGILPGGRLLSPAGSQLPLGGFPIDIITHPSLPIAYAANAGYSLRAVQVIDAAQRKLAQQLTRNDAFFGLALDAPAAKLYASGGRAGVVDIYDIAPDGSLSASLQLPAAGYPAGLALSQDRKKLYVARFIDKFLDVIDLASHTTEAQIPLPFGPYAIALVPAKNELWAAGFADSSLAVIDLQSATLAAQLPAGGGDPLGLAVSPDSSRVYVSISDADSVVAFDTATRTIVATRRTGDDDLLDENGSPLPATSPSGILLDPSSNRLFVARAADNAVEVLDATTLAPLGAIPVGWYPTSLGLLNGKTLVVTNGKGLGAGPLGSYDLGDESGKQNMQGSVSLIDLSTLDLSAATAQVRKNLRRPSEVYPFDCQGIFPVPTKPGSPTPIQHVVLIVKENKTYDSLLGDLEQGDGDPSLALFGESITPNIHALARRFAHHDNFYDDGETSVQGHLWLTSSFVNDYMERIWFEDYRGNGDLGKEAVFDQGQPDFGTFFTHLIKHKISFTNYGEVVGSLGTFEGETVLSHTDMKFPGIFFNTDIKDETKAAYVASQLLDEGNFPAFTYVLLPNDHTHGTSPGALTTNAMISDNDYGVGLLVDRLSHSPAWASTAVFIVEDDPQQGADHVDYHRSICVVASPWAKRSHVSHVHTSIPSLFRTFELILGLPPMNRFDAMATPLYDVFTMQPDLEPFTVKARTVPDDHYPSQTLGQEWSRRMDFRGPDRNPDLGALLWWERKGSPPPGSRIDRFLKGQLPFPLDAPLDDDDASDREVFDRSWDGVENYLRAHPEIPADIRPRPLPPQR